MKGFPLPPLNGSPEPLMMPQSRQVTLVGANGAGKSRFMEEMIRLAGGRAFCLSALTDSFPASFTATMPDFEQRVIKERESSRFRMLVREWEALFPGNRVIAEPDSTLLFATSAGDDLIPASRLSRGELAAFFYLAATLFAPRRSVFFIDSPSLFLHPSIVNPLWNIIERLRHDCRFVYDTTDPGFIGSRSENVVIWVKSFDKDRYAWDYELIPASSMNEDLFVDLIGSRRPVLFIEGDAEHSIDARLYGLVFPEYTVRPLGSCDKVIESTRSFSSLRQLHPLDTHGIVDRDRRTDEEVAYLRHRNILVPDVAEIENVFLDESVIRVMAEICARDPERVVVKVRHTVMGIFASMVEQQALQHTRHRMKRDVERKIDARFTCITALELHIKGLINRLRPREIYNSLLSDFRRMLHTGDYQGVLRVCNHKPMLTDSNVSRLLGFPNADAYISGVLGALRHTDELADKLRHAIRTLFHVGPDGKPIVEDTSGMRTIEQILRASDDFRRRRQHSSKKRCYRQEGRTASKRKTRRRGR